MKDRFVLVVLVALLLAGCTAQSPTRSIIPTSTTQAQPIASFTYTPVPTDTSAPTVLPTDTAAPADTTVPTKFPPDRLVLTPCSSHEPELVVFPLAEGGKCEVYLSLHWFGGPGGYSLRVPSSWTVRKAGPEGMNLMFNDESNDLYRLPLFVQRILITDTTLERLDTVAYSFELSPLEPVVKPSERRIKKEIITVGASETVNVLALETIEQNEEIHRYFLPFMTTHNCKNDCAAVYVFQVRFMQSERNTPQVKQFLDQLQDVVASIRFVIR